MTHEATHLDKSFIDRLVLPEIDVFARDYGLRTLRKEFLNVMSSGSLDLIAARRFSNLFNTYSARRIYSDSGRIFKLSLSPEHPYVKVSEINGNTEVSLISSQLADLRLSLKLLITGLVIAGVLLLPSYPYVVIAAPILFFLITSIGKKLMARLHVII